MVSSARWYVARLGAMSGREVAWRVVSGLERTARRAPGPAARPDWEAGGWREALAALAASDETALVAAAERIARGELALWGRTLESKGPPRWGAHPFTGAELPEGSPRRWPFDPKPVWELHRQQHLVPLAAGAALAGRPDWAELWAAHVLDWIDRNPPGRGPAWSSGYEAAHRLVTWAWSAPLVAADLPASALARVADSFAFQAEFVRARPSRYSSANNHRLAELTGLLAASRVGAGSLPWDELWAELEREVARQTFADGGSREQGSGYFLYVLEILWTAGVLARSAGRPLGALAERLEAMLAWLRAVADREGEPPPVGDDAEDRFLRPEYFEPRRARVLAGRVRALLAGELTLAAADVPGTDEPALLPESGYAVFRGPRSLRGVFDFGDLGFGSLAAHGHADALSFLLDVDGRAVLRDSGTGSYHPAEGRELYRATGAHCTVTVDGESQARTLGPHLWGRRYRTSLDGADLGSAPAWARASHDGYRKDAARAIHTRTVAHVRPELLVVLDRIRAGRPCTATLAWQLAPGASSPAVGRDVFLSVAGRPAAEPALVQARYSPRYGWHEEAPRALWSATGTDVLFASVVLLGAEGPPPLELAHDGGVTALSLGDLTLVERWSGPPEVRA